MKMISSFAKAVAGLFIVSAIAFVACKKDNSNSSNATNVDEVTYANSTSESDAEADLVFEDVFDNVVGTNDEVGMSGVGVLSTGSRSSTENITLDVNGADTVPQPPCFSVTVTQLNPPARFPLKIVVDFGSGCTGRDGRTRKGKIITIYTRRLVEPGAKATTTFDGYFVNDVKVEGTHIIENLSAQDKRIFQAQVIGARLTRPNDNYTEWSSDKTIVQTEGLGTPLWPFDDVFTVSGQANGALHRGSDFMQWSHIISKPLVKRFTCRWIVKGEITIKKGSNPVAYLDYGSGDCDNKATITVNGTVREITLH